MGSGFSYITCSKTGDETILNEEEFIQPIPIEDEDIKSKRLHLQDLCNVYFEKVVEQVKEINATNDLIQKKHNVIYQLKEAKWLMEQKQEATQIQLDDLRNQLFQIEKKVTYGCLNVV